MTSLMHSQKPYERLRVFRKLGGLRFIDHLTRAGELIAAIIAALGKPRKRLERAVRRPAVRRARRLDHGRMPGDEAW